MHQDPFPDPGEDDGEEPDGSLPPDAETGPEQGLFLCLPAGEFDPDQFAQSGPSPDLAPGAMTATLMDLVAGPDGPGVAGLSDDQLAGELHLTYNSAAGRMDYATTVAERLPASFAALGAGKLDMTRLRILEEET